MSIFLKKGFFHRKSLFVLNSRPSFSTSASSTTPEHQQTDVLIVGGGITGASLACALSQSEFFNKNNDQDNRLKKIILLDNTKLPNLQTYQKDDARIPEPRVITLTPNSLRFFKSIGALQLCNHRFVTPFNEMLVYEEVGQSYMKFDLQKQKEQCQGVKLQEFAMNNIIFNEDQKRVFQETQQNMGASIENNHILAALLERAKQLDKCEIIQQKVVEIKPAHNMSQKPQVKLENGTTIEAQIIVGSDGEKSKTREEYGIQASGYSYNQSGIVCTVSTIRPNTIAFQRFLKSGPIALLPLWGNYSSIVWSCPPDLQRHLQELSDDAFVQELNHELQKSSEHSYGGVNVLPKSLRITKFEHPPIVEKVNTKRFAFPLILQHSDKYADTRMALIGDAAHRIHPMAGQGLNIGITDVAYLANAIVKAKKSGQDIGNYDLVLKEYERNAKINSYAMTSAIEVVKNSYMGRIGGSETLGDILGFLRNIALDTIQMSEVAKYNFMNYASGNLTHPVNYEWETR